MNYITAEQASGLNTQTFIGLHHELCYVAEWPGRKPGYWMMSAKDLGGSAHAHRLVARLLLGRLRFGDLVLHRCGNASCHNPLHLYVGGDAENQRDRLLHATHRGQFGPLGLAYPRGRGQVLMPQPLQLSTEKCRLPRVFDGFSPGRCHHVDWLYPTHDGFLQLSETDMSGKVVGAHRKAFALFNGPLDKYEMVNHICGDRHCLNPFHLVLSGRYENPRDWHIEHDKRYKLSRLGLALIADLSRTAAEVAHELGVHRQTVSSLRAEI